MEEAQELQAHSEWVLEFQGQQRDIIELWDACNVPLVHRSYFFILFKGDPSDAVYMEVELRRLFFIREAISRSINASGRSDTITQASRYVLIILFFIFAEFHLRQLLTDPYPYLAFAYETTNQNFHFTISLRGPRVLLMNFDRT